MTRDDRYSLSASLEDILPLLARQLYSDPSMFIRELACNGYDAVQRRRALPGHAGCEGWLRIQAVGDGVIRITDSGIGMTERELRDFLSCFGRSANALSRTRTPATIGQFGVGFASAFAVAEQIRVHTRSALEPERSLAWSWCGGLICNIRPAEERAIGTSVELTLLSEYRDMASVDSLRDAVLRYITYLPVALDVPPHGDPRPRPPWRQLETDAAGESQMACVDPLGILPTERAHVFTRAIECGHAVLALHLTPLCGRGRMALYSHGVLVANDVVGLMPESWHWLSGLIEDTRAALSLDRSGVRIDYLDQVRAELVQIVEDELIQLASHHGSAFDALATHQRSPLVDTLIGSERLMNTLGLWFPFETTLGRLPYYEILSRVGSDPSGAGLFFTMSAPDREIRWATARAQNKLVIWCQSSSERRLLSRLTVVHSDLDTHELTWSLISRALPSVSDIPAHVRRMVNDLQRELSEYRIQVEATNFEPGSIPVVTHLPDVPANPAARERQPNPLDALLDRFVPRVQHEPFLGRLTLNINCPTIQKLAGMAVKRRPTTMLAALLVTQGIAQSGVAIAPEWLPVMERLTRAAVGTLARSDADQTDSAHVVCFFAHEFNSKSEVLHRMRSVLEHHPYFWEVRSAAELEKDVFLYENVLTQIVASNLVIADITEWNPNVILELGLALGVKENCRVIIIAERQSFRSFSDINGRLVFLYDRDPSGHLQDDFEQSFREYMNRLSAHSRYQRSLPFLGYRLLTEQRLLSQRDAARLRSMYPEPLTLLDLPAVRLSRVSSLSKRRLQRVIRYLQGRVQDHRRTCSALDLVVKELEVI